MLNTSVVLLDPFHDFDNGNHLDEPGPCWNPFSYNLDGSRDKALDILVDQVRVEPYGGR
jgi:hypothetical protein